MARKSKYMTGVPFTAEVSDAIRHHVGAGRELENARKDAFEDRNAAVEEINDIADEDSDEAHEARTRHSKAIIQIDSLTERIAWHNKQVKQFVEKADEPELDFMYDMPPDAKAESKKKAEAEQMKLGGQRDDRPVGGSNLPKTQAGAPAHERGVGKPGKKPRPAAPDASMGEGHNEHFNVSVNELDCREDIKGKLILVGLNTVADVVRAAEKSADPVAELEHLAVLTDAAAKNLWKSVTKFRSEHRKAAAAAEKEGAIL